MTSQVTSGLQRACHGVLAWQARLPLFGGHGQALPLRHSAVSLSTSSRPRGQSPTDMDPTRVAGHAAGKETVTGMAAWSRMSQVARPCKARAVSSVFPPRTGLSHPATQVG